MTTAEDDRVLFEVDRDKRIATITLNNPEQRNSYDASMRNLLGRYLDVVADGAPGAREVPLAGPLRRIFGI